MSNYESHKTVYVSSAPYGEVGRIGYIGKLVLEGDEYSLVFSTHTHNVNQVKNSLIEVVEDRK